MSLIEMQDHFCLEGFSICDHLPDVVLEALLVGRGGMNPLFIILDPLIVDKCNYSPTAPNREAFRAEL